MSQSRGLQKRKSKIENKRSLLLNPKENKLLFDLLGSGCVSIAAAVVQLFLSDTIDETKWIKQGTGVAVFVRDAKEHSYFIRIYDLIDEKMVWQQELYSKFKYYTSKDFFHTFECDNCEAGLNFASEDEADLFKQAVHTKLRSRKKRRLGKSSKKAGDLVDPGRSGTAGSEHAKKHSARKKSTFTKDDIGEPSNYRHVSSISGKGVTSNNFDPDIKELFHHVGIDNTEVVDEDTMDFIYDFVEQHGGMNELKKEISRRPPPPVPSSVEEEDNEPPPRIPRSRSTKRRPPPPPSEEDSKSAPKPSSKLDPPPVPPIPEPANHLPSAPVNVPAPPPGNVPAPPPPPPPPPPPIGGGPGLKKSSESSLPSTRPNLPAAGSNNRKPPPFAGNARDELMESIISSSKSSLKPVTSSGSSKPVSAEEDAGIVGALARALALRKTSMAGGSDEDSDEDDDFEDDEEWD